MSDLSPVSALAGAARSAGLAVSLEERGLQGMVTIRADLADTDLRAAIEAATGLAIPETRRASFGDEIAALWMAPDEVMFLCAYGAAGAVVADLSSRFAGRFATAIDVSDARAVFRLTGAGVREVIAKGAPVDLSGGAFGPGDVRRSHLGQVAVAFWQVSEAPETFDLVCFRSVAGYVFDWLAASAAADSLPGVL